MSLRDWNGHPLDSGFYEGTEKGKLFFIKKDGETYYISSIGEDKRELKGTPEQHFRMLRACPHDYLERKYKEARKIQEFIASRSGKES